MKLIIIVNLVLVISTIRSSFLEPTKVYWNIPSNICIKKGFNIPLEDYGIIFNTNQHFYGEKIVTLYEESVGLYPYLIKINSSYNKYINGGLPQNVDIDKHLKILKENINMIIPDEKFNGLAIIDIEKWRPLFKANWLSKNIYQKESITNIIQRLSNITQDNLFKLGEKQFNNGALNFMIKTIKMCKLLRPFAKWGFYGFPVCDMNGNKRKGQYCYHDINNKMTKFLKYADALYPTAYIYGGHSYKNQKKYIEKVLKETKRLNIVFQRFGYNKKEIYIFHKIEIYEATSENKRSNFYDPYQLCISQGQSITNKCDGIIIWSTSNGISRRCEIIKRYVELQFQPYIQKFNEIYETCNKIYHRSRIESICNEFLTTNNIKQWCNTEFYSEKCHLLKNTSIINT